VRQAAHDGRAVDTPLTDEPPAAAAPPLPSREQPERRAHRLARSEEVVALQACGASVRPIVTRIGSGQRTVQRWLRAGRFPERRQRSERPGQVAPCAAYLRERWAQGGHNTTQLWQELRERGYTGCYGSVAALVAPWRGER
jgi:transposase